MSSVDLDIPSYIKSDAYMIIDSCDNKHGAYDYLGQHIPNSSLANAIADGLVDPQTLVMSYYTVI
jgi:hypothetical protein